MSASLPPRIGNWRAWGGGIGRSWRGGARVIACDARQNKGREKHMSTIEKSIEVNVPEYTAYAQWTRFEEFPQFMEGVKEVKRNGKGLHWKAEIAGQDKEWDAEITEETADQCIAWRSQDGVISRWVVTFHQLSNASSKVLVQLEYNPQGLGVVKCND